jgi:hypothetical protein
MRGAEAAISLQCRVALLSVVLAALIAAIPGALGTTVVAAAGCPQEPTLRQLIALDRQPGPLSSDFPPIFGSYHEGAVACYGDQTLGFRAFVAAPEGLGGALPYSISPGWLVSESSFVTPSDKEIEPGLLEGPWFAVAVPPRLAQRFSGQSGRWVQIQGHFNDPAAARCRVDGDQTQPGVPSDAQAAQICGTSFVVESVHAVAPDTSTASVASSPRSAGVNWLLIAVVSFTAMLGALSRRRPSNWQELDDPRLRRAVDPRR